ncbi:MAG: signal peptide peptidase SppA [Epsilonproteobacteria bacterium]|nr:signal peptide peptidase SppA [Campylobacterota bacterium]
MDDLFSKSQKLHAELSIFKLKALKEKIIIFGVVIIVFVEIFFMIGFIKKSGFFGEKTPSKPYVAVINFDKEITVDYINKLIAKMDKLKRDKDAKEILIIFNTPGGSPSASDEFNAYLKQYTKTKKVNVYIESMAASGGYYVVSAIRPIIANKNAIVGSIGVIMPHYVIGKLAKKLGIEEDSITVGKYKKPISLFKKADKQQRQYLYSHLLNPTYQNFLKVVSHDRNITLTKLKQYADGKIYIANTVKGILVDQISTLVQTKQQIKQEIAHKYHIAAKEIRFYNIELNKKELPFFKVEIQNSTLKTLQNMQLQ